MGAFKDEILRLIFDTLRDLKSGQSGIDRRLDRIEATLETLTKEIKTMDANTAAAIKNVTDQMALLKAAEQGLGTVIDGVGAAIQAKIDAAIAAAGNNADVVAALQAVGADAAETVSGFSAEKDKLTSALLTGTPNATDGTAPTAPPADASPSA